MPVARTDEVKYLWIRLGIMTAFGLRFPVCSVGGGIVLDTRVSPRNAGTYELGWSKVTPLRGLGPARSKRIPHTEERQRGPLSARRVLVSASAEPAQQSVERSAASFDSNGSGAQQDAQKKPDLPEEQRASGSQKFNWNTQWYPVAVINDLDEDAPTPAIIMGRSLALWYDKSSSKWQVYADQCPHRLAPLSEGSISEEGHLRCSYHGWTFKGDSGECTFIPQAPKEDIRAHTNKRACVSVYPSMVQQGILWFWPDHSQGPINIEAAANPPPAFAEFDDPSFTYELSSRDLEYGYETLIENLMDPAHVNFAHHNIQGNRKNAKPLNYRITTEITPTGFKGQEEISQAAFYAPCCFTLSYTLPDKSKFSGPLDDGGSKPTQNVDTNGKTSKEKPPKKISLILLCIPISPGRSRLIWSFPLNFARLFFKLTPPWVRHMTNNLVLDSDMYLLHLMERRLEQEGSSNWNERFYLATTADAYVRGFRKWLNDFAGGAPDWAGRFENRLPSSPPRRILLDRYYQHVVKCKSCTKALKNFKALEVGLQVLAIALVGLVAASALVPIRPVASLAVPLVIGAVLSTILSLWLSNFIHKTFYFHDYNHAVVK